MFNLVLVGLNHRTAKIDIRQQASFDAEQLPEGLKRLSAFPEILESMIVSTCNRVEILSCVKQHVRRHRHHRILPLGIQQHPFAATPAEALPLQR